MTDEHDAPSAVVVCKVVVPGVDDIVIAELRVDPAGRHRLAGHLGYQGGQRELAVERRELPAHLAKPCELLRDDGELLWLGVHRRDDAGIA